MWLRQQEQALPSEIRIDLYIKVTAPPQLTNHSYAYMNIQEHACFIIQCQSILERRHFKISKYIYSYNYIYNCLFSLFGYSLQYFGGHNYLLYIQTKIFNLDYMKQIIEINNYPIIKQTLYIYINILVLFHIKLSWVCKHRKGKTTTHIFSFVFYISHSYSTVWKMRWCHVSRLMRDFAAFKEVTAV